MNDESLENKKKELREIILSLNIFKEIDKNLLNYQDSNIKFFLHALCPKHINEIDEVINKTPIDTSTLKKIIVDSIYYEFNAVLQPNHKINTTSNNIEVGGNEICTNVDYDKHYVSRQTNNAYFAYVPTTNSYTFSDGNRNFFIKTCGDNNEGILMGCYDDNVDQTITDNNLTKSAKECLIFLTSVSLIELETYHQTFAQNIIQEKEEKLPSPETIISAMQEAQKTVEEMRNKEEENKGEEDKKNDNKNKNNNFPDTNLDNIPKCCGLYTDKNGKKVYRCFGCDIC